MERFESIKKNNHPTVKPVSLMTYLCRLITPEGGVVLDPFMGSGSTGIAARLEGFRFIGMEMDEDYYKIAEARINSYREYKKFTKK
jgi:site-specific DNA-methyltransferase (adenine-specific)